jgi:hypothetical protein
MNEHDQKPPGNDQARRGAEGAMGDGGDPAGASSTDSPGVQKELTQGGLGEALASATGQPGLARTDEKAKAEAGAQTPAKE